MPHFLNYDTDSSVWTYFYVCFVSSDWMYFSSKRCKNIWRNKREIDRILFKIAQWISLNFTLHQTLYY